MIVNLTADGIAPTTKSDTVSDPKGPFIGLYTITAGTVKFLDAAGNNEDFGGATIPAFTLIPVKCVRVWSTGTGATVRGLLGIA